MAVSRTVALLGILFLSFLSIVYMKSSYKAGFQDILLLVGRALFLVLLSSWLVSILYPRLRSSSASAPPPRSRNEDEDMKRRQEQARKEQQETLCNKEGELVTEHLDDEDLDDTPNVRAMRRRKIPESATRILVQPDPPQEKKTLLQWMQKIGYPPALYTVCTSYPRRALDTGQDLSLEDAGIDTDTVLNIEEKDTSTA
ncbi:UBX domain-containing protein 6-like [Scleropages formosus]|uniref:UBX domain-containing protein 6-like n=1 Tax=Scleropages formosus TaxID=113540 RepID=A0A0P7UQ70_SCLFO|nr:UBX domain-containing protein 6-like [Scleropages formosus]